ncbi:hypoxanthine phosphoribosyltransferase [Mycobacterium sp. URHB0021]
MSAESVEMYPGEITSTLISAAQIGSRVAELGQSLARHYRHTVALHGQDLLLLAVLKGAVMFASDLARAIPLPTQLDWIAMSSYGSAMSSSEVVDVHEDPRLDITNRDVLIIEDIADTGRTLSWLMSNLATRKPRSLQACALLRKPWAALDLAYVGFDIPDEFVVGYGLGYADRYRDLPFIATLNPSIYQWH